ncbi:hypothetical protein [Paenibacillus apiarius]|uniref:hypothetical protein n=1 Tax=Paenibacillus apiarius TaxID=46240 RepID=UPI00198048E9|nr:hypothetical protein [Paenibacillus apiarius]MBN3525059.1 hypothetical protein [Paenibacillus apiarius]
MAKQLILQNIPEEKEIITLEHSLKMLNYNEIIEVTKQHKVKISEKIRKKSDLEKYLCQQFKAGYIASNFFNAIRERAFNPELNVSDGFYLSFSEPINLTEENLKQHVTSANAEINEFQDIYEAEIELLDYRNRIGKLLFMRKQNKFAYDRNSMFSTKFLEEHKILVEINFAKQIVYFQTSNVGKFRIIRTVVQDFLSIILGVDKLKLFPPKMSQQLSFVINEDGDSATRYEKINSNTIKVLDLLLEINNHTSKFSEFECIDITLDHEDSKKKNTKAKITTQTFGGGDLLATDAVKNLVLEGRIILEVDFKIVYNETLEDEQTRKHTVMAGIVSNNREFFRIYMHNNDLDMKQVINRAYNELNSVFIEHFSAKELRNEDGIKKLLGLR